MDAADHLGKTLTTWWTGKEPAKGGPVFTQPRKSCLCLLSCHVIGIARLPFPNEGVHSCLDASYFLGQKGLENPFHSLYSSLISRVIDIVWDPELRTKIQASLFCLFPSCWRDRDLMIRNSLHCL